MVGTVIRNGTLASGTAYTFGNPNNLITATGGASRPTSVSVTLVKTAPTLKSNAITRTYTITPSGGSGYTATVQLRYLDAELNGNTEASLELWHLSGGIWSSQGQSSRDATNNWVQQTAITAATLTGDWALGNAVGPVSQVRVETLANGTGTVVPAQTVASGSSLTVFAIGRDLIGNFVANVSATWSVNTLTGGVATSDLSTTSGTSTVFTGHLTGTGTIHADAGGGLTADSGTITVTPTITSVSPNLGPIAGGTSVVISGSGFTGASAVTFGGTAATSFNVDTDSQITAVAPAHTSGLTDVRVTTVGGTSAIVAADGYTYVNPPTVTAVSPNAGPIGGGTSVTLTGTNFVAPGATVIFGATPGTGVVVNSATSITVTAPAHVAGTVDITVTTVGGTSAVVAADQYTYVNPPTVTAVSPLAGPIAGGTVVTLTGTNFVAPATVSFGGTAGTAIIVNNATTITVTAPAHAVGTVDITVTTPGGTSAVNAPADQYTYAAVPTVTSVSPNLGPIAGGTSVTIAGANYSGTGFSVTAVTFGGTAATSFIVNNSTSITAVAPAHASGVNDVRVTTVGGQSTVVAADQFTYVGAETWTGATSTAWATPGNWNPAVVPGQFDDVTIPNVATQPTLSTLLTGATAIRSLTINSGATLTIATTGTLTVTTVANVSGTISNAGAVAVTGTLSFLSGATYNHAQNGGTIPTATWAAEFDDGRDGLGGRHGRSKRDDPGVRQRHLEFTRTDGGGSALSRRHAQYREWQPHDHQHGCRIGRSWEQQRQWPDHRRQLPADRRDIHWLDHGSSHRHGRRQFHALWRHIRSEFIRHSRERCRL